MEINHSPDYKLGRKLGVIEFRSKMIALIKTKNEELTEAANVIRENGGTTETINELGDRIDAVNVEIALLLEVCDPSFFDA